MRVSLITAMSLNRVIGLNGKMPWHLPADLKRFQSLTMGKPIIMGRKTFESIGKPLPGRTNIVVTRSDTFNPEGCQMAHSLCEAIAKSGNAPDIMVIGGEYLYRQMIPYTDRMYFTIIHTETQGDVYFPEVNMSEWKEVERVERPADDKSIFDLSFIVYDKV